MNIAIVGSRNAGNINLAQELEKRINIMEGDAIVSGGARGIDTLAASYAKERNLKLIELRPDYAKYGRGNMFIRNRAIVEAADMVVAFWDGESRGTKYSIDYANKIGRTTLIVSI